MTKLFSFPHYLGSNETFIQATKKLQSIFYMQYDSSAMVLLVLETELINTTFPIRASVLLNSRTFHF